MNKNASYGKIDLIKEDILAIKRLINNLGDYA